MPTVRFTNSNLSRAAALISLAVLAAACSHGTDSPTGSAADPAAAAAAALETSTTAVTTTTTTTPPPTTTKELSHPLAVPGEVVNQYSLTVGDCFDQTHSLQNGLPVVTTTKLSCNLPHEFEVYHRLEFPAGHPAIYPGDNVVRDFALESCYRVFDTWVGEKFEVSALDIEVLTPTQDNFEDSVARYRGIQCLVHRTDGVPLSATTRRSGL